MTKKIYGLLFLILLSAFCILTSFYSGKSVKEPKVTDETKADETKKAEKESASVFEGNKNLTIWYTDDALTDYLTKVSLKYQEENGIRVTPVLKTGISYLEEMNDEVRKSEGPDLFIMSNDTIEKAYLSGLCSEIEDKEGLVSNANFPESAIHAVTYDGKKTGYPLYFETTVFLCNESYIEDYAVKKLVAEKGADNILTVSADDFDRNELMAVEEAAIPGTLDGILDFADGYEAPEEMEAVFKWDVSDIFYNYFIVGNTIDVGGVNGDDPSVIYIYNSQSMGAMLYYQSLNRFFSIDPAAVSYSGVVEDFMNGKIAFTVATTDVIEKLERAKQNGKFKFEYRVCPMPMVSDTLPSKPLSVTNALFVCGYSDNRERAEEFASYVINDIDADFYKTTGKLAAKSGIDYDNEALKIACDEYARSASIPKLMVGSGFWAELEIAFTRVWGGEDVNDVLSSLESEVRRKFTGESVSVNRIPTPVLSTEAEGEN